MSQPEEVSSKTVEDRIEQTGSLLAHVRNFMRLARPNHWLKNTFIFAPLLFGGTYTWDAVLKSGVAFASFCLLVSGIYCLNDVIDAANDRQHVRKKHRPVASGEITPTLALAFSSILVISAFLLGLAFLPLKFSLIAAFYVLNNLLYFFILKHRVIADVLAIATGFVLRILAGCAALSLKPSSWILVCGFSLAMLLGFGKRRLEIDEATTLYRRSLNSYSEPKLNLLLGITSSLCLMSYMLFTVSPQTIQNHHTENLIYTVPVAAYGIFRYLFKVQEGKYDGPLEALTHDHIFVLTGLVWLLMVSAILFIPALQ